ncbi:MAG: DegT/DnrJ/EryC1/StrS family aminotransferase [Phycisphaerae bacterium]|nr:DegT/DnrJ/EryC1/StrS family aminotransferase [Phycisphaerae bacterium]
MSIQLAISGGSPVLQPGDVTPWPYITEEDKKAVLAVLEHGNMAEQRTEQAEKLKAEWAAYVGVKHCIPVCSGTAALHLCVAGLGLEPGDEVIVPAFTYWASAAAVLHHNCIPVFVDIDPVTYTIDPGLIEEAITPRTRAIMPVHIHGMSADMGPILEIAARHGLGVIEDGAQAQGATYKGQKVGSLGDCAGFSLQMSKNLTSGSEGGLFVCKDDTVQKRAALLEYLGEVVVPGRERQTQKYNAYGLGWAYRPDTLGEAMTRSRLRHLDQDNAGRIRNCEFLNDRFAEIKGVEPPATVEDRQPVYYCYVLGLKPSKLGLQIDATVFRDKFMEALQAEGVPCGMWQRLPVPAQEIFQTRVGYGKGCPWSCKYGREVDYRGQETPRTGEFIASHVYLTQVAPPNDTDVMAKYVDAVAKVLNHADELI